ncbi:Lysozyme 3 [Amphibalanus amphitrite]|uniref:lysozyme n=1 Tax=Amphibalanus amphitrite TaxID=1232801 RepID=A0A6A4WD08_AMPAM|nr:Lysozyme 3 [Amphibalanus amphitrite]
MLATARSSSPRSSAGGVGEARRGALSPVWPVPVGCSGVPRQCAGGPRGVMTPLQSAPLLLIAAVWLGPARADLAGTGGLGPDRYCLSCLCTAATGCDVSTGCLPDGGGDICGPFYMSEPYWRDAHPRLSTPFSGHGFHQCASDVECAGEAVSSYMQRFSRSTFYKEFIGCATRLAGLLEKEQYRPPTGHAPMV